MKRTDDYPTPEELNAILGPRWAICRNTERNRERYEKCITRKMYTAATQTVLSNRKKGQLK